MVLWAVFNLVKNIFRIVLQVIIPRPVITDSAATRLRDSRLTARVIREFETNYGNVHPDFFQGSFSQAFDQAKNDVHFLMVILEADEHDSTDKFNRETLTSELLAVFLQENQILVWIGNVKDPEAFQASITLQATAYPFIAFIVLQSSNDNPGSSQKMTVVDHIEGFITPEDIAARLTNQINHHEMSMQRMRNKQVERESARQIHDQQDMAYQASLLADQEKEHKAHEPSEADKNVARLSFRLANGERIIRRFKPDDTVEGLWPSANLIVESLASGYGNNNANDD
ncbi:16657_t:CDS:2 [Entrophospora sp. SA101]|nr:16657_t:CDS:2 [Entrophospora sp. SA101]CAJ0826754.1 14614_t:CDS:2 [Entrophospora sp. SA101]